MFTNHPAKWKTLNAHINLQHVADAISKLEKMCFWKSQISTFQSGDLFRLQKAFPQLQGMGGQH